MLIRYLLRITLAAALVGAGLIATGSPAQAQSEQVTCSPDGAGGQICLAVAIVEHPGGWTTEVTHQSGGEVSPWCTRSATGNTIVCQTQFGWYNGALDCYIARPDDPVEPHEDMRGYEEHGDEGVVYIGNCFHDFELMGESNGMPVEILPPTTGVMVVSSDSPEGYGGTPSPLPDLIEEAINALPLSPPDIVMAPDPAGAGLVHLPVWMSTTVSEGVWGETSRTAAESGVSVTATAESDHILWEMGDGGEKECANPGTPYDPSYGVSPSPDCGYDQGYSQPSRVMPDGRYPITATTSWDISWESNQGAGGEFTVTTGATTSVQINELQVLVEH